MFKKDLIGKYAVKRMAVSNTNNDIDDFKDVWIIVHLRMRTEDLSVIHCGNNLSLSGVRRF